METGAGITARSFFMPKLPLGVVTVTVTLVTHFWVFCLLHFTFCKKVKHGRKWVNVINCQNVKSVYKSV